ncbi:MAG: hypothetical protein NT031_17640, partial [Planctomycetota bacterium]|nr:hypothetical protein [Planctomycetota bacterium]
MKRVVTSLVVLTVVVAFGANGQAAVPMAREFNSRISGTVTKLDKQKLTLSSTSGETVVTANERTKVYIHITPPATGGPSRTKVVPGKLSDVKVGQTVSVTVNGDVAIFIRIYIT